MNKKVRQAVFERAGAKDGCAGKCECGCGRFIFATSDRLDHYFGRAKAPETVENCWALAVQCDESKTANRPSATYWCVRFALNALKHGYTSEAMRALSKIETLAVKGLTT